MAIKMTRDEFEDYAHPFYVYNHWIEDVPSIFALYRDKILEANSIDEMKLVAVNFRFLAAGVEQDLQKVQSESALPRLKRLFYNKTELSDLRNFRVPPVMLFGTLVSREFNIPEFYGALQYIRATQFNEDENG